jgi:sulfonate transport system permease protein
MTVITGFEDGARIAGAPRKRDGRRRQFSAWLNAPWIALVSPLTLFFAWWWVTENGHFSPQLLVSPGQVTQAFLDLMATGELEDHLYVSLARLFGGFAAGAVLGVLFGMLIALSDTAERYTAPLFQFLRQLPTVALIPMFILIFGVGESFKIFIVIKATFFVVALAAHDGIRNIPKGYFDVSALYNLSFWDKFHAILFPAAVPSLLTGIRIGLSRSWMILVGAELLAAENGLGQMMEMSRQMFRMDVVMVGVILTGVIGFSLDRSLRLLGWWLMRWRRA